MRAKHEARNPSTRLVDMDSGPSLREPRNDGDKVLAALADREIEFLDAIGLLPGLGLFCRARLDGWRLACLGGLIETYGKAIGTGLL
jgi:hypothetical protein